MRPLAVEDLVRVLEAAPTNPRVSRKTIAVTGPEAMTLGKAVRRIGAVLGRKPLLVRLPVFIHCILAWIAERTMKIPMMSLAQLRILSEGIVEALPACDVLPDDLQPRTRFTADQIRKGLPEPERFGWKDLRCAKA